MTRIALVIGVTTLAIATCPAFSAQAQPSATPETAAKQWLSIVDGSEYEKSWFRAGTLLKTRMTAQDWKAKLAPVREPLGAIMERKILVVKLSNTEPNLPDGKYAVVQFNSRFLNRQTAVESVGLVTEEDRWAVIGYFIK
jgi:hypothetical protein